MQFTTADMLKKAVLDSRERVRDYTNFSEKADDGKIKKRFKSFAETEGRQARELMELLNEYEAK